MAVSNGTVGLRLALAALGVEPGDAVLVSAYSFIACAMAVSSLGAVPVPLDMTEGSPLSIDTALLASGSHRVAAVMVVHVQGHAIPVAATRALCTELGVPLVEDACQALGASSADGRAGTLGDVVVTSFQQSKQISSGEGGLVAGPSAVIERIYRAADLGAVRDASGMPSWDADGAVVGENLRMTEMQAALVADQMGTLEATLAQQRHNRSHLRSSLTPRSLGAVVDSDGAALDSGTHTLFLAKSGSSAVDFCADVALHGVLARVVWRKTYFEYGVFRELAARLGTMSIPMPELAMSLAPRILSIPTSKYLSQDDALHVGEAVNSCNEHLVDMDAVA